MLERCQQNRRRPEYRQRKRYSNNVVSVWVINEIINYGLVSAGRPARIHSKISTDGGCWHSDTKGDNIPILRCRTPFASDFIRSRILWRRSGTIGQFNQRTLNAFRQPMLSLLPMVLLVEPMVLMIPLAGPMVQRYHTYQYI